MKRYAFLLVALATAAAAATPGGQAAVQPSPAAAVDAVFRMWNAATPGCAVGVGVAGKPVLARGYGMADLEHDDDAFAVSSLGTITFRREGNTVTGLSVKLDRVWDMSFVRK